MKPGHAAVRLERMLEELATVSDTSDTLTRTFLSPAMRRANEKVAGWMQAAGLTTRVDRCGNLIGRRASARRGAKTLLIGSHLDTVKNAGRFDGALGVLLPIVALEELRASGAELPFAVEVVGFSEEEGVRFASAYLGSQGFAGQLRKKDLALRDEAGVSVKEALVAFNGGRFRLPQAAHRSRDLLGYVEVHIEQGPVLEQEGLAAGVVSAIAGQSRFQVTWSGRAGHAGTTPMALRRDAFAAAAEFAVALENLARSRPGLVGTIGAVTVSPGASNVIPAEVRHTVDVRHARDAVRRRAVAALQRLAGKISQRRHVSCRWQCTQDHAAVACAPSLTATLRASVRAVQGRSLSLSSGAGHDAVVLSALTPVAMLFVRCRDGLSHHPAEHVTRGDLAVALEVVADFLRRLATAAP